MKKAFNIIGLALALLLAFSSCQKAPFLTFTGQKSFTFKDAGGSETITFSCNRAWTVTSSESWLTVSPAKGDANEEGARVTITCAANTTYDPRNATVTISSEGMSESISISQETNYGLIVSPTTFNLTNAEQDIDIEVQKNVQYSVAIDKDCSDWISLGGTKALTTDKVSLHIAANSSYDDREGKITFKRIDGNLSQTVTIKQSQTNGLFITTSEYNLSNESHNLTVEVKSNVAFEVTSQDDWIEVVETKALKASTISLSITANETYDNRTGTVIVKQTNGDLTGTITINQHQTDGLFVSPTEFEIDNTEQSVDIVVEQNVAYNVVIPDDAKTWIAVAGSSQTKALSKETITLNIAKNTTYDDREASVTIKQVDGALVETVKIKQAYGEGLIIEKTEYDVAWDGGSVEVSVKANVEFEVIPEKEWVHLAQTKALSSSTITLIVDKNETYEARESSVTFRKKDGDLSVDIIINQGGQVAVSSVILNKTETSLLVGKSEELTAEVLPENATDDRTIYWSSSDETIATVENGKITAISEGSSVINAKAGNAKAECIVNVYTLPAGALAGEFSVSATKKVHFSKGNLYYDGSNWGFEAEQYYFRTYDGKGKCDAGGYNKDSGTTSGHWGLFGWVGASSTTFTTSPEIYGVSTSTTYADYGNASGEALKADWGTAIDNKGTWRTLSGGNGEWKYLFDHHVHVGGTCNDVPGWFIAPDGFEGDADALSTAVSDWAKAQAAGIVFLPAAGYRYGSDVDFVGVIGYYWSSTAFSEILAYGVGFNGSLVYPDDDGGRDNGYSVRLITESKY